MHFEECAHGVHVDARLPALGEFRLVASGERARVCWIRCHLAMAAWLCDVYWIEAK